MNRKEKMIMKLTTISMIIQLRYNPDGLPYVLFYYLKLDKSHAFSSHIQVCSFPFNPFMDCEPRIESFRIINTSTINSYNMYDKH